MVYLIAKQILFVISNYNLILQQALQLTALEDPIEAVGKLTATA